jgi:hypothetical protein
MVVPNLSLADSGWGDGSVNHHEVLFDANPNALVFKNRLRFAVTANVCCNCGHVELTIPKTGPEDTYSGTGALWNAHQHGKQ